MRDSPENSPVIFRRVSGGYRIYEENVVFYVASESTYGWCYLAESDKGGVVFASCSARMSGTRDDRKHGGHYGAIDKLCFHGS
jgi:hypothetical protein